MSLDGYIAGSNDEFDWIVVDPDIDFKELFRPVDAYLLGRRTFEVTGGPGSIAQPGSRTFVFSRTLSQDDYEDVTIVGDDWKDVVRSLREESGGDIWLFGGGELFRSLCEEGLVDTVEVSIVPVLLGGGVPLVPELSQRIELTLTEQRVFNKTGTVSLVYAVNRPDRHQHTEAPATSSDG
jgi:dihydrofolate reductase